MHSAQAGSSGLKPQAMKFYRLLHKDRAVYALDDPVGFRVLTGAPWQSFEITSEVVSQDAARLLAPIQPSKIIAAGLNYRRHAKEMGLPIPTAPLIFLKPPTAVAAPAETVFRPAGSHQVDFEGELAVVIGRGARNISEAAAPDYILGYTLANDITARDLQKLDGQWTRAKSFDGFCPLGPCIVSCLDPEQFYFQTRLNNELRQTGRLKDMIFTPMQLVAFVSSIMTLLPGDVILTGTPPGIGPMQAGDCIRIESPEIGILENRIA